jgi:hypothetical protein
MILTPTLRGTHHDNVIISFTQLNEGLLWNDVVKAQICHGPVPSKLVQYNPG